MNTITGHACPGPGGSGSSFDPGIVGGRPSKSVDKAEPAIAETYAPMAIRHAVQVLKSRGVTPEIYEALWNAEKKL